MRENTLATFTDWLKPKRVEKNEMSKSSYLLPTVRTSGKKE